MDAGGHDDPLFNYSPATVNALAAQIQANRFQKIYHDFEFLIKTQAVN